MQRIGSRAQVMNGIAKQTGGGLTKKDLKYNKQGKIVSKKMSAMAKNDKRLQKAGNTTKKKQFGGGDIKITISNYLVKMPRKIRFNKWEGQKNGKGYFGDIEIDVYNNIGTLKMTVETIPVTFEGYIIANTERRSTYNSLPQIRKKKENRINIQVYPTKSTIFYINIQLSLDDEIQYNLLVNELMRKKAIPPNYININRRREFNIYDLKDKVVNIENQLSVPPDNEDYGNILNTTKQSSSVHKEDVGKALATLAMVGAMLALVCTVVGLPIVGMILQAKGSSAPPIAAPLITGPTLRRVPSNGPSKSNN